ncbi:MAG TPA: glutathione S-transferase family protein [Rhizomicrobium sp.]|nr:glutathione S-transferase family protein [Rhizomicrobium sp.]
MLRIWGRKNSINVQKAMWSILETGIKHERIDAGGTFGGLNTPEFLAKNPNGLIPAIDDDGAIVWESQAIVRYIAARYGAGTLWPEDPAERAKADEWMEWNSSTLQPALMGVFMNVWRTPEFRRNPNLIRNLVSRCGQVMLFLDKHLEDKPYIAGEKFSMGDIPCGAMLYRYFELDIERPNLAHVSAWYSRLQERSAFRNAVMISFEDLKGH